MKTHKIKKIKLVEDDGYYYLDVTYLLEDDRKIKEVHIPRVDICFNGNLYPKFDEDTKFFESNYFGGVRAVVPPKRTYNITAGATFKLEELDGVAFTETIIKEKTREMTIEEIEKKLGYKIKIVSEDKK